MEPNCNHSERRRLYSKDFICHCFGYNYIESRSREGRWLLTAVGGASAVPAGGGLVTLAPGQLRHQPAGTMTGARGASLEVGSAWRG